MNSEYYKSPKAGKLMQLFWKAAGADKQLLEKSTYSEQVKYFCMGGIVIATGVMASLAGGYAFYTIFSPKDFAGNKINIAKKVTENGELISKSMDTLARSAIETGTNSTNAIDIPTVILSIVFGVIWGLIIFNIDRFIVTSTGKGDGTEAITWQEFKSAIPRIIMGTIIAMTISKPIEIRMFQTEIAKKLEEKQKEQMQKIIDLNEKSIQPKIKIVENDIQKIETKISTADSIIVDLQNRINYEVMNGGCKGKCEENKIQQAKWELRKKSLETSLVYKSLLNKRQSLYDKKEKGDKEAEISAKGLDGLLERIKISDEIGGWISVFITLLFLVIELTPIFFKMMLIKGPYDYMDENVKELAIAEYGIEITSEFYTDKNGEQLSKVVNHAAVIKKKEKLLLLKAQEELNEQIIRQWKEKKKKDIEDNLEDYIKES